MEFERSFWDSRQFVVRPEFLLDQEEDTENTKENAKDDAKNDDTVDLPSPLSPANIEPFPSWLECAHPQSQKNRNEKMQTHYEWWKRSKQDQESILTDSNTIQLSFNLTDYPWLKDLYPEGEENRNAKIQRHYNWQHSEWLKNNKEESEQEEKEQRIKDSGCEAVVTYLTALINVIIRLEASKEIKPKRLLTDSLKWLTNTGWAPAGRIFNLFKNILSSKSFENDPELLPIQKEFFSVLYDALKTKIITVDRGWMGKVDREETIQDPFTSLEIIGSFAQKLLGSHNPLKLKKILVQGDKALREQKDQIDKFLGEHEKKEAAIPSTQSTKEIASTQVNLNSEKKAIQSRKSQPQDIIITVADTVVVSANPNASEPIVEDKEKKADKNKNAPKLGCCARMRLWCSRKKDDDEQPRSNQVMRIKSSRSGQSTQ